MTEHLDADGFKKRVFDWEGKEEWKFEGELPAIVDFYAEWCGPCKMLGPVLEELSGKYEGKMDVFKVDIDKEPELASVFGVQSVPDPPLHSQGGPAEHGPRRPAQAPA